MKVLAKSIPVKNLRPSQKEIDFEKVCEYIFCEEDFSRFFADPVLIGDTPLIIYNQKYIVDGHHRWANILAINPEAKVAVLDFEEDESARQFINRFDTAENDSSGIEQDIYKCSDKDILQYIKTGLTDSISRSLQMTSGLSSKEDCINYLLKNFLTLRDIYRPEKWAPQRMSMPQLNEPAEEALSGMINLLIGE